MNEIRIGTILRALIQKLGTDLRSIERETEIPYTTLHTWLHNGRPTDFRKIRRLARHLGVSIDYLVFGEEDKNSKKSEAEKNREEGPEKQTPEESKEMEGAESWTFEVKIKKI